MNNIKIIVATHKDAQFPDDEIFLPIQVGKKNAKTKIPIQGDDEGDNISEKNPNYCELTAQYWAWKNLKNLDFIGLCHYRRYFKFTPSSLFDQDKIIMSFDKVKDIKVSHTNIMKMLIKYDIVLSKPLINRYNLVSDYCFCHINEDFLIMQDVIMSKFPEYINSFNYIFKRNKLSHYNMMVTNSKIFNNYSKWIFDVLFEIEKYVKISEYPVQARVFGYMSERLLMVYCRHHNFKIKYLPIYYLDDSCKRKSILYYTFRNIKNNLIFKLSRLGSE